MRAVQVSSAGGELELVERPTPEPGPGQALVKVHACGICHSDSLAVSGGFPGMSHPLIPGHEIAGEIAQLGAAVSGWQVGQRVGVGWFGGNCGYCEQCRRGHMLHCENVHVIPGITADGGYADYVTVNASALAAIPDDVNAEDAAPLMCAGVTTFNGLRRSGVRWGDRVAVLGIGGLGHLGVQFAVKMGLETVAIARGTDKGPLAEQLGAHHYIDSTAQDPAEELRKLGGADVILSTVTNAQAMAAAFGGLRPRGQLVVLGAAMEPLGIPAAAVIGSATSIVGHPSGTSRDSQDTLEFSALTGVRPMIETVALEQAAEAYGKMMSGAARFRMVLTM
jgi:D-arabinose 1-dehydrogenase-like Zn-dependent alcohol dehydrogenase